MYRVGDRVKIDPKPFVVFSLRDILHEYGSITGVVARIDDPPMHADAPYVVKLDHREDRHRCCREDELIRYLGI